MAAGETWTGVEGGAGDAAGRPWPWIVGIVVVAVVAASAGWLLFLWRTAEGRIDQRDLGSVGDHSEGDAAGIQNILLVGNDSRAGLTPEQRRRLTTGQTDGGGERTDTIMLVQVRPDDGAATVVSFPRDLLVDIPGHGDGKINAAVELAGRDALVAVIEDLTGVPVDHYVEVSIPAFLQVVRAVGPIEVCLEEPLVDPKAGADLTAGCHDLGPAGALAYVRSRRGARGDFDRIARQQRFIGAIVERVTSTSNLVNPVRLYRVVTDTADSLTTDADFGIGDVRTLAGLADDIRTGAVATVVVPGYPLTIDGSAYVSAYEPGLEQLAETLAEADRPAPRGPPRERAAADVAIWTAGNARTARTLESVLFFAGFEPALAGLGPADLRSELPDATVVYHDGSHPPAAARWVANVLGAPLRQLPDGVEGVDRDAIVWAGAENVG